MGGGERRWERQCSVRWPAYWTAVGEDLAKDKGVVLAVVADGGVVAVVALPQHVQLLVGAQAGVDAAAKDGVSP